MKVIFIVFRIIISLLLIPCCVAFSMSFCKGIFGIKAISDSGLIFLLGAFSYAFLHLVLFKLDFLYVLGHELLHGLTTTFFGGKVKDLKVSSEQGSIKTTTPNFIVALAPYLIPGYTIFITLVYFIASFFIDVTRYYGVFMFLLGFTLMMHITYTAQSVRERQPDLFISGYLFSISLLYIVNIIVVFLIISFAFKDASFFDFLSRGYETSKKFYYLFWKQLFL